MEVTAIMVVASMLVASASIGNFSRCVRCSRYSAKLAMSTCPRIVSPMHILGFFLCKIISNSILWYTYTMIDIRENILLSEYTTTHLGGRATYFAECNTAKEVREALVFAKENDVAMHILGGGSNTLFSDDGFDGLVLHVNIRGISFDGDTATAGAGEVWDDFVRECVKKGLAGIEALSGIPGTVGAVPVQNVGAYGCEVSNTIFSVQAIYVETGELVMFPNKECEFGYRTSRFKTKDRGLYVLTGVVFKLEKGGLPKISYPALEERLGTADLSIRDVRKTVLEIREEKSLSYNEDDPHSHSCGSFFENHVMSVDDFEIFKKQHGENIPFFLNEDRVTIPVAWLIELAGFEKGFRKGGVGISPKHTLALVNYDGTTEELLSLAADIQKGVKKKFAIDLRREPVVVA